MMMVRLFLVIISAFKVLSAPTHHQYKLEFNDDENMTTSRLLEEHLNNEHIPFTRRVSSRKKFDMDLHLVYEIDFRDREAAEVDLPRSMKLVKARSHSKSTRGKGLVMRGGPNKFLFMKATDTLKPYLCDSNGMTRSSNRDQKDCDRSIENIVEVLFTKHYTTETQHKLDNRCKDFNMSTRRCRELLKKYIIRRRTTV